MTVERAKHFLKILRAGRAKGIEPQWQNVLCEALEKVIEDEKRLGAKLFCPECGSDLWTGKYCPICGLPHTDDDDDEFLNTEGENDRLAAFHFSEGE
jgi:rubrerythrin